MQKYKGDNLYAKLRYNIHHNNTDLRWRVFIKNGEEDEIMFLCKEVNFYKAGRTYAETIDGVGHYSILFKADRVVIDDNLIGWIL